MKEELFKFIADGISITKTNSGYTVFTVMTQHFDISSLEELTEERFTTAVQAYKDREEASRQLFQLYFENEK